MSTPYRTTAEQAERLRCSTWLVLKLAKQHGIGLKLPGRAGWRFTDADDAALRALNAPEPVMERRRKRRAS
jgi:hypothetical protein